VPVSAAADVSVLCGVVDGRSDPAVTKLLGRAAVHQRLLEDGDV